MEWIRAKTELPPAGQRVIATDGVFVGEAYITNAGGDIRWYRHYGFPWEDFSGYPVIGWMPMPEAWKERNENGTD